jgi:prepilin-type N-terminal cleavage/methylation domain-containing protein
MPAFAPRPPRSRAPRGFTLIELMAVSAILAALLLMLPPRLDGFGDRSRLDSAANTMVSVLTAAKEQAVIDGHEVIVQYQLGDVKDRQKTGRFRYVVSSEIRETPDAFRKPGDAPAPKETTTAPESEWVETSWRDFPTGVILAAYSQERGQWAHTRGGAGDVISVSFQADGTVKPAHAVRLVSSDLEGNAPNVVTVLVNALTSSASIVEGESELPEKRDAAEFR